MDDGSPIVTMHLRPLDRDDGVRLVASRAGVVDRREAVALWERAGGSPFWLGVLAQARDDERDVDDVVAARTRGLGADASLVLGMLAILGRPVDALELEGLVGWPAERTLGASTDLVERGLAIDEGGATRLAHDLIRDAVVGRIPAATRRELEGRIATALERRAGGEVTVLLAALEHRVAAGSFDAGLALRILRAPQRRLIGTDGVHRVAELGRDVDDPGVRVVVDQATASLAAELGDQAFALERWTAVAGATSDSDLIARACLGAAVAAYDLGRGVEARRWLEKCRVAAGDAPELPIAADALEARILLWLEHSTDAGRAVAMRGVERGRQAVGSPPGPVAVAPRLRAAHVDALAAAWEAAIQAEDVDAIVSLADESLEASREMGLREVLAARAMVGMALEYAAHQQAAADMYRRVWDEAWRAVLPIEAVDAGYRLASVLFDGLQLGVAARIASEAERLATRAGDHGRVRDRTRLVKFQLAMATSDWRAAIAAILAAAEDEPDPHYRFVHHQLAATWLARVGVDEDDAIRHTETARSLVATAGCPGCGRDMEVAAAEVFARYGRRADALEALATWDAARRRTYVEAEWLRRRAGVLLTVSDGLDDDGRAALDRPAGRRRRDGPGVPCPVDGRRPRARPRRVGHRRRGDDLPAGRRARRGGRCADHPAPGRPGAARARRTIVATRPVRLVVRRDERALRAGARGRRARRARCHEPRDRGTPVPVAQDRRAPRLERARQARAALAGRAGGPGRSDRAGVPRSGWGTSPMNR